VSNSRKDGARSLNARGGCGIFKDAVNISAEARQVNLIRCSQKIVEFES
jgi:hypothetical protein